MAANPDALRGDAHDDVSDRRGRVPRRHGVFGRARSFLWLPCGLDRMDQEYEDRYYPLGLSMKPSELWRQQGYSIYQHEPSVA